MFNAREIYFFLLFQCPTDINSFAYMNLLTVCGSGKFQMLVYLLRYYLNKHVEKLKADCFLKIENKLRMLKYLSSGILKDSDILNTILGSTFRIALERTTFFVFLPKSLHDYNLQNSTLYQNSSRRGIHPSMQIYRNGWGLQG